MTRSGLFRGIEVICLVNGSPGFRFSNRNSTTRLELYCASLSRNLSNRNYQARQPSSA